MIPDLIQLDSMPYAVLPPGIHDSTLEEVQRKFAHNKVRKKLFDGLKKAADHLFKYGCDQIFLDGSYVTDKKSPNDYDVCWDISNIKFDKIDPVFFNLLNNRILQKQKYLGEFLPAFSKEGSSGKMFLNYFQEDKLTGKKKGIIRITNTLIKP